MVMQEQAKRLAEPVRWTRTSRLAVIAACTLLVAALAAVAVVAARRDTGSRAGCIEVTFASTLGAAAIHPCGEQARALCAKPAENPAAVAHGHLLEACRQAGLPYGKSASTG